MLFRAQHHSMALEMELSRRNIPFHKYGGLRFVEMAHVKDLVSFLRLAENPKDAMAGLRVLGLVPGIGPKTAAALLESLSAAAGDFPAAWAGARVPEPARAVWPAVVELFATLAAAGPSDVPAQVHAVRSVYGPLLERRYDNVQARLRDLEQIEGLAARSQTRSQFLADLVLDPPSYTQELAGPPLLDEDYLILSTMHSAKGLEFDVVYVIHAADGNIPSDMATGSAAEIEEERRLLYVACTRAREQLYVSHPLRYYTQPWAKADTHGYAQRSRFLTHAVTAHFEELQTGPEEASPTRAPSSASPPPPSAPACARSGRRRSPRRRSRTPAASPSGGFRRPLRLRVGCDRRRARVRAARPRLLRSASPAAIASFSVRSMRRRMSRVGQPRHDSSVLTRTPVPAGSMRQTCTAWTPNVLPRHPSSEGSSTARSTEVMVPGPDCQRKVVPGASGPSSSASRICGFHSGQRRKSVITAHTSSAEAAISRLPAALMGAVWSMSMPDSSGRAGPTVRVRLEQDYLCPLSTRRDAEPGGRSGRVTHEGGGACDAGAAPFHGDRREPDRCCLPQYVCVVSLEEPPENPVPVVPLLVPSLVPAEPCGPSPSRPKP